MLSGTVAPFSLKVIFLHLQPASVLGRAALEHEDRKENADNNQDNIKTL